MVSSEYDEYRQYLITASDEELELETDDTFIQLNDEDEGLKYALCVEERNKRDRALKSLHISLVVR